MAPHPSHFTERIRRLLMPTVVLALLITGVSTAWLRARNLDARLRAELLADTRAIAEAITTNHAISLALTAADDMAPQYRRLDAQLRAYALATGRRDIYTALLLDDRAVPGPDSAAEPPLTGRLDATLDPHLAPFVRGVYASHQAVVEGPYAGEDGLVVSSLVPMCDPHDDRVLMVIGMDADGAAWQAEIRRVALMPVVATSMLLAVLAGSSLVTARCRRRPGELRRLCFTVEVGAVVIGGLIVTSGLAGLVRDVSMRDQHSAFRRVADAHAASIAGVFRDVDRYEVPTLARFIQNGQGVTWDEFHAFLEPLATSSMVRAWEWVPRVPAAELPALEEQARRTMAGYTVFELDAQGDRVPVATRDAYYPVMYALPLEGNEMALGYDLGSEPIRRAALEEAGRTGLSAATDIIGLVQEKGSAQALLVLHPIWASAGDGADVTLPEPSGHEVSGYALAVLPLEDLLKDTQSGPSHHAGYLSLALLQLRPDGTSTVLASTDAEDDEGEGHATPSSQAGALTLTYPLFAFGRAYAVVAAPGHAFPAGGRWDVWATWLAGVLSTALATAIIALTRGHQWTLERQVSARTAALQESEARHRTFIDSTSDLVFMKDDQFRYVVVNRAQASFFGREPAQVIGLTDPELMPAEAAVACRESDRRAIEAGTLIVSEEVVAGRTYELIKFPVALGDGRVGVGGFVRDITERREATHALEEREARYRSLFENNHAVMLIVEPDSAAIVDANPAACAYYGWDRDVLRRMNMSQINTMSGDQILAEFETARAEGRHHFVFRHRLADGSLRDVEEYLGLIEIEGRRLNYAIVHDITERRRAEAEVERNLARLRSLVNIAQYRAENVQDLLDYALNEALRLTGSKLGYVYHYSEERQEFILNTWSRDVMKECAIQEPQTIYQLDKTGIWGEAVRQRRAIVVNDFAAPHPLKRGYPEGHAALHSFLTVPVMHDGSIVAVVGVANKDTDFDETDALQLTLLMDGVWRVVEGRQAQERIEHLNRVLRAIRSVNRLIVRAESPRQLAEETCAVLVEARGYSGAMVLLEEPDGSGPIVAEAGLGAPFRPMLDRAAEGMLPPQCVLGARSGGVRVLSGHRRDCEPCPVAQHCATMDTLVIPLEHDAEVFGHLVVWVERGRGGDAEERDLIAGSAADLSLALHSMALGVAKRRGDKDRGRLEDQLAQAHKMEAVGRLAGGIAHDFNNMLSVISGYAELAKSAVQADDPLRQDIEEIQRAAAKSALLTRQILTFARQQEVQPRVVDLNDVVADNEGMLRRLMGEDISLVFERGPALWPVLIDPSQVSQVLTNLAANARDAIDGVGTVTIATANRVLDEDDRRQHVDFRAGQYVEMAFSDSGMGMTREVQEHLFEPFFTTKEKGKGTGLGLATIYGIVKQNTGLIAVDSEPGRGTTFRIYLPREFGPVDSTAEQAPRFDEGGTETILLVEDEQQVMDLCRQYLQRQGYTVFGVSQPDEALMVCENYPDTIHLLITDVVMPTMNGKELAERIERVKPEAKVLYMSGYSPSIIATRGVIDTHVYYLQKPFNLDALGAKVREVLESR